jgi:hypothetical protein
MDIVFHGLMGFVLADRIAHGGTVYAIAGSILPDVAYSITSVITYALGKENHSKSLCDLSGQFFLGSMTKDGKNKTKDTISNMTHTMFCIPILGIVAYYMLGLYWWVFVLGLSVHVLMDLFTHEMAIARQPWWPLSHWRWHWYVDWFVPQFFIPGWIALLIILLI